MSVPPSLEPEQITRATLMIFLDETGDEQYTDPNHPVFGIGGCAVMSDDYVRRVQKPWNLLKRDALGLVAQPFHAVDFERSRPTMEKILAINMFLMRGFHRIAVTTDRHTERPKGYDGHESVSTILFEYTRRLLRTYSTRRCVIIFEHSDRANKLLERNFPVRAMDATNLFGEPVDVVGYTMPKSTCEAGLEIADLIVHTAGKQQRLYGGGYANGVRNFTPDFRAVFHAIDRSWVTYQSVVSMKDESEDKVIVDHWPQM